MGRVEFDRAFLRERERFLDEWAALLRFPSIGTDPSRRGDCLSCARWLARHLKGMGFHARLLPAGANPVVFAERHGAPGAPTVLLYGHYDVQPADPLEAWTHPPFEPAWRGGRLYARGACDNKGQLFYALKAIDTLRALGVPLPSIKVVLEGGEESGSHGIRRQMASWRSLLKADVLLVTDVSMGPGGRPAITVGLRGVMHVTAILTGARHDLHSGVHGGVAPNPAEGMAQLIASLRRPDGGLAVKGFYRGVGLPTPQERRLARASAIGARAYEAATGVAPVAGERRFVPVERTGFRPSLDINGIHSGYGGEGSKTIIPATAMAKIAARIVPGQDPAFCMNALIRHLEAHCPRGLTLSIPERGTAGSGLRLDPDSRLARLAAGVLREAAGRSPVFVWEGASVPVVGDLARVAGAEPLLVGFGREEDRIHAPDESFSLDHFRMGYRFVGLLLSRLACPESGPKSSPNE